MGLAARKQCPSQECQPTASPGTLSVSVGSSSVYSMCSVCSLYFESCAVSAFQSCQDVHAAPIGAWSQLACNGLDSLSNMLMTMMFVNIWTPDVVCADSSGAAAVLHLGTICRIEVACNSKSNHALWLTCRTTLEQQGGSCLRKTMRPYQACPSKDTSKVTWPCMKMAHGATMRSFGMRRMFQSLCRLQRC